MASGESKDFDAGAGAAVENEAAMRNVNPWLQLEQGLAVTGSVQEHEQISALRSWMITYHHTSRDAHKESFSLQGAARGQETTLSAATNPGEGLAETSPRDVIRCATEAIQHTTDIHPLEDPDGEPFEKHS